jgi:hypothetical protein
VVVGGGVTVVLLVVGAVVVVVVEGTAVVLVVGFGVDVVDPPFAGAVSSSSSPVVLFEDVERFWRLPAVAPSEALSISVPSTVGVEQATTVPTTPARSSQPARRA